MTDTELDNRLERLSDEDLHGILSHDYTCWLYDNVNRFKLDKRIAREILDLRQQLKQEREECAKIAESYPEPTCRVYQAGDFVEVAEKIRARQNDS